ncbi:exonuclease mut-7 homolog isoform X1 [Hypomesus transpacificus]|uniref:exonuclease mut-7 homolog isoform X1 n=2 Tax=Hypomesus transpacificus TaxID=137520 RepID=UPI001F07A51B|nr:exonuclease mut-7 homolog isoform X1 [Hypomesus transpacificus]XP_046901754.1 exonuclease mut-7 homolog isoform X1 [Hypomesus transpacificus]
MFRGLKAPLSPPPPLDLTRTANVPPPPPTPLLPPLTPCGGMSQASPKREGVDPTALRDQLFDLWTRKELEALRATAQHGFSSLAEPLAGLLELLEGCPGKQKGRASTLGHCILQEFERWRRPHPQVQSSTDVCSQVSLQAVPEGQAVGLQLRALGLLTDAQPSYMEPLLDLYQLGSLDPALLRQHISRLLALCCYREAAVLSAKLKMQRELDIEEVCVPLILHDKLPLAESWVAGHPDLEERLVILLDSWCQPGFNPAQLQRQFANLSLSKHQMDQIQAKLLSKQVFRLMDKFSIDPGLCPNSVYKRKLDSLRFLMYKRFVEKGMSDENWKDHVQSTVAGCPELQVHLVELVLKHSGLQSAAQWSLQYGVPRDRLPFGVWDTQQSLPASLRYVCGNDSPQSEEWDPPLSHRDRFYQLPITRDNVHFLDTQDGLQRCQDIIQAGRVVGVDMEWRAGFGTVKAQRVTLIQLAVQGQVFLLDLCADGFWQHSGTVRFIRTLFSEPQVLKLGYGMSGDLKSLLATWPQFTKEPLKTEGVLDLLNVHQQIQRSGRGRSGASRSVLVGDGPAEKGLSLLVQQILGRPLDKIEQLSNWERRPLRTSQLRYAAADAYCLLEVYSALSKDPAGFGLPADLHSVSSAQAGKKTKEDKKRKEKAKQARQREERQRGGTPSPARALEGRSPLAGEAGACVGPPISPQQLKVVCDNMLQGLGRCLRSLGVDVRMLENTDDHRVAAQLAQSEGRVILTCGQPFHTLRSQVGEGRCLALDCSEKAKDQAIRVLQHFNIQPTKSDIFSRCQVRSSLCVCVCVCVWAWFKDPVFQILTSLCLCVSVGMWSSVHSSRAGEGGCRGLGHDRSSFCPHSQRSAARFQPGRFQFFPSKKDKKCLSDNITYPAFKLCVCVSGNECITK